MKLKPIVLLSLLLMAFITGFIVLPAVHATFGNASVLSVINATYGNNYMIMSGKGNIFSFDGWIYAFTSWTEAAGSVYYVRWYASNDGGLTWISATSAIIVDSSTINDKNRNYFSDAVWDGSRLRMVSAHTSSGAGDRALWYREYIPSDGTLLLQNNHTISYANSTWSPGGNDQLCAICMMNGKPVVVESWNSVAASDIVISVFFANAASPTSYSSWTQVYDIDPMSIANVYLDAHVFPVNDTAVLCTFHNVDGDSRLYGKYVSAAGGFESDLSGLTLTSTDIDHIEDSNYFQIPMCSSVAKNSENSAWDAVDRIATAYVDTDRNVYFDLFNVSTATIDVHELVFNGSAVSGQLAYHAGVAKSGLNFYVSWAYQYGGYWYSWARERDENGIWSSPVALLAHSRLASSCIPSMEMGETVIDSTLGYDILPFVCENFTGSGLYDESDFLYINATGVPEPVYWEGNPPYVTAAELENIDSGLDWVFTEWKYYTFTLNVPNPILDVYGNLTEAAIRFNVTTGEEEIQCDFHANNTDRAQPYLTYSADDWAWTFNSSMSSALETRTGEPVNLQAGTVSYDAANNETDISFQIWFTAQCLDDYVFPGINVSAQVNWLNYAWSWFDAEFSFYLYAKGGFAKNFQTSNAARANSMLGEEWASLYAYNGSNVYNEIWFRDLQHIKMLPYVEGWTALDPFSIVYQIDYSVGEGEWLPGWEVYITPMTVHFNGLLGPEVWINMTVSWYQGTGTPGSYTFVKSDYLYMFFHNSEHWVVQPFQFRFWFDAWFNSINASSTGGGRINAFEYSVKDNADLWMRWLVNNWGPKDDVLKESTYMADLKDANNLIMSSERIKMVRCRVGVVVYDAGGGQLIEVHNYEVLDYTHSKELPLHGIQTPVFDDTKMPDMGQTALLGAIFSMFAGIGQWLSENVMFGGLNLWGNFVAFLDTIAGMLGAPKFFSNLFAWIGNGFTYMIQSATYIFTLLSSFFLMIGQLIGAFITTLGEFVLSIIATLSYLVDILGGIGTGAGNLWVQFNIMGWLEVALVFYPLYLIILWDQEGMDAVVSQLSLIWGIAAWLFGFFIQIIMAVISFAHTLIESIPVAE